MWDLPTRLAHWLMVGLVAVAWVTGEAEGIFFTVHQLAGYGLFTVVVFRLIWGFVGSPHSLFRSFVRPWPKVRDHAMRLARLMPPRSVGHNPLGGWMAIVLLAVLTMVLATGAFAEDDELAGPLAHLLPPIVAHGMAELHEGLVNAFLGLIGLHVTGVVVDMALTRDNLVRAMWTGYKTVPGGGAEERAVPAAAPAWRAVAALAAAVAAAGLVASL